MNLTQPPPTKRLNNKAKGKHRKSQKKSSNHRNPSGIGKSQQTGRKRQNLAKENQITQVPNCNWHQRVLNWLKKRWIGLGITGVLGTGVLSYLQWESNRINREQVGAQKEANQIAKEALHNNTSEKQDITVNILPKQRDGFNFFKGPGVSDRKTTRQESTDRISR